MLALFQDRVGVRPRRGLPPPLGLGHGAVRQPTTAWVAAGLEAPAVDLFDLEAHLHRRRPRIGR